MAGFTAPASWVKRDVRITCDQEGRARTDVPESYQRCLDYSATYAGPAVQLMAGRFIELRSLPGG